MYVWSTHSAEHHKPGMVADLARGQTTKESGASLSPFTPVNLASRTRLAVLFRVSPLILHTQAESSIINHQSSIINLVLTHGIHATFREGVHIYCQSPLGKSRIHGVTLLHTDGDHCRVSADTVVVVVLALKPVLTSIQYFLFLTLQGKETKFRGHKLTQNKVQKNRNKIKRPRESPNTCDKNMIQVPKNNMFGKTKKNVRAGKPPKGSRAHRSKLGS